MDTSNIQFTFLLYFSRSGSTMLANQIARNVPGVLVFPELDFVGLLFESGDRYVRGLSENKLLAFLKQDQKIGDIGLRSDEWLRIAKSCAGKGIVALLTQVAISYAKHSKKASPQVVVFQRGTLLSVAPEIEKIVSSPKFIHIVRDPRAAVSSIVGIRKSRFNNYDHKRMGRSDAIGLSKNWLKYTRRVYRLRERHPHLVLQIKYEDLCRHQEVYLRKVADFLSLSYSHVRDDTAGLSVGKDERELHTYIDKPPMMKRLSAWHDELSEWRGFLVEHVIGDHLKPYGYDLYFSKGIGAGRRFGYLTRGQLDYAVESFGPILRRLVHFCLNPRLLIRALKLRIQSRENHAVDGK